MIACPRRDDESGVALGLVVILAVLIGVLAAGLLAVLRSDLLEATVQANGGQRALHLADAGAQAAAAQLRAGAEPAHYDADGAGNSDWAHVPPDGGPPGETLALDGGTASVSIRYLLPAETAAQQRDERHAPEQFPAGRSDYPDRGQFLAVSEGSSGETWRKVEIIFYARTTGDAREVVQWGWRAAYSQATRSCLRPQNS